MNVRFHVDAPGTKERQFIEERGVYTSKLFLSDYPTDELPAGLQLLYVEFEGNLVPEETCVYWFGCLCLGTAQMFLDGQLIVDNKTYQVKRDAFFIGYGYKRRTCLCQFGEGRKGLVDGGIWDQINL